MEPARVLLCNHHPILRNGLRQLLETEPGCRVIAEAANGREAVVLAEYTRPDIVLLDVSLPHLNGIAAAREIRSKNRDVGIVFVTVHIDEEYVCEAFKAGARGYVLADAARSDLLRAIRVVAKGATFLSPCIASRFLEDYRIEHGPANGAIPQRDAQLFCFLAEGYSQQEIAEHLDTTVDEVRAHLAGVKTIILRAGIPEPIKKSMVQLAVHTPLANSIPQSAAH